MSSFPSPTPDAGSPGPGRPTALWVSTALDTRGGIASYVRMLGKTPLATRWSVRHIATHRDGSAGRKILTFARALGACSAALVRRLPDGVHVHMASYGSFVRKAVVIGLARLRRVPVVVHVHGAEFDLFHDRAPWPVQAVIRSTLGNSAAVIALGEQWAERLKRIAPAARVHVVPNAVAPVGPAVQPTPGAPVHVVFLGELGERKGTFTLLDAWAKVVVEAAVPARLTIAGSGEHERARLRIAELGLGDSVQLRGWLAPDEVAVLLRSAQVLTLPSFAEGQPMAILEAMANGLCVVASNIGGIPELLAEDCGLLVRPGEIDALAAALCEVIDDPAERVRLGERALDRVRTTFDPAIGWRRIEQIYREVTSG
jgi:glycosyltransferase involved in cell wall biosynthesis